MSTDRETTRIVRSWLETGVTRLPDRVLDAVLDQVPATPQRRPFWRAWRFPQMTSPVRYAIAAAAVLAVALVGYQFLPSSNIGAGGQTQAPSAVPTTDPAATAPVPSATPTRRPAPFPSAGALDPGRHHFTLEGVSFTIEIASPGWTSGGEIFIGKGREGEPDGISFLFWPEDPDFVYTDSCGEKAATPVGRTSADMAGAIAGMSQLELVSGPTSMTLDGNPAQHVVVRVPDEIPCAPNDFYLWGNSGVSRYASTAGSTYWVWIIDVDDTRIQIDGESFAGADPSVGEELKAIVESIRFE
jgi:hypothetical protein